jgi:hypothetical protein
MSVHAGSILTVGGNNVIDRVQSAGLGDATVPIETIREVGNKLVVDKIPGEPDFTFSMESLDVSTDMMAWLTGKVGAQAEPAGAPGAADADGTEYKWQDCGYVNVTSPWKDALNDAAGNIVAGHLIPAYYPTRVRYAFGVIYLGTAGTRQRISSVQSVELEATVDTEVEREMGNDEPTGRVVNGLDCTGSMTVRSKDAPAFIALLSKVTGVADDEVFGYLNQNALPLEIAIQNPKNPGATLKTLYVNDAIFQIPGTPARVNAPTDFALRFDSQEGTFSEFKGAKP